MDKIELRAAAARLMYENNHNTADFNMLIEYIDHSEAIKPAHWSINPDGYYPQCSNCGYEPPRELIRRNGDALIFPRYCPECGADTKRKVK